MKQDAPSGGLISTRAAINLIVICVLFIVIGVAVLHAPRIMPTPPTDPVAEPTTVTRVNEQVIELNWNGTPQDGFVLSEALPMRVGDRVEIVWRGGCFASFPQEACLQPWGFFDVLPESWHLFRFATGAYAVHILHGHNSHRRVWPRGEDRLTFTVRALPLRLYFNTIIVPGVAYSPSARRDIAIDGYSPPLGNLIFRVINRR